MPSRPFSSVATRYAHSSGDRTDTHYFSVVLGHQLDRSRDVPLYTRTTFGRGTEPAPDDWQQRAQAYAELFGLPLIRR